MWHQRSRIRWIKGEDKNTKFFHSRAIVRKRKNRISCFQDDARNWYEGRDNVLSLAHSYFLELFSSSDLDRIEEVLKAVDGKASNEMNIFLGLLFIALEVK